MLTAIENDKKLSRTHEVDQIDFAAKLLGGGAANSAGNGRLANAAGAKQCYDPSIAKLVADLTDHRFAPSHHDRSHGEPALVPERIVPARLIACERDDDG